MKRTVLVFALFTTLLVAAGPSLAAERTVTLSVKMWCPSCPYIVKRSLAQVPGVLEVAVSYDEQVAVVRYDDDKTSIAGLTQATADVGFPSTPVEAGPRRTGEAK